MRKIGRMVFIFTLCLSMLIACGTVGSAERRIMVGTEIAIFKNETVRVTGATIDNGKIVVAMDLNFNTITLENLKIGLIGYDVDLMNYDKEETVACNKDGVFSKGYVGQVSIVFTDDSITDEQKLSEYTIQMVYADDGTWIMSDKFMLDDF